MTLSCILALRHEHKLCFLRNYFETNFNLKMVCTWTIVHNTSQYTFVGTSNTNPNWKWDPCWPSIWVVNYILPSETASSCPSQVQGFCCCFHEMMTLSDCQLLKEDDDSRVLIWEHELVHCYLTVLINCCLQNLKMRSKWHRCITCGMQVHSVILLQKFQYANKHNII